jgi:hypothetical protein
MHIIINSWMLYTKKIKTTTRYGKTRARQNTTDTRQESERKKKSERQFERKMVGGRGIA